MSEETKQVATRPPDQMKLIREKLNAMESQFKLVLPSHISADAFVRIVLTAVQSKPSLLNADRNSLFSACMQAATQGLCIDGQEAALVPFKGKIKYMPMVKGICTLARQSGEIKTINAQVVYTGDKYRHWIDEKGEHFEYERTTGERGAPRCTFAYAITKDGGLYFEEISEEQMDAIEDCCNADDTPWKGPFRDEMKRKSALRRLAKYRLPSSADLNNVVRSDDDMYDLEPVKEEPPKYLPGIVPLSTTATFVKNLSKSSGGPELIRNQIISWRAVPALKEWAQVLEDEALLQGIFTEELSAEEKAANAIDKV